MAHELGHCKSQLEYNEVYEAFLGALSEGDDLKADILNEYFASKLGIRLLRKLGVPEKFIKESKSLYIKNQNLKKDSAQRRIEEKSLMKKSNKILEYEKLSNELIKKLINLSSNEEILSTVNKLIGFSK